jgi:hypothetical protein
MYLALEIGRAIRRLHLVQYFGPNKPRKSKQSSGWMLPGPYPLSRASAGDALRIEDVLTFSVDLVHEVGAYSWSGGFLVILPQLDPDEPG